MRNITLAALTAFGLLAGTAAMADDFDRHQDANVSAVNQQATADQMADPTSPNSLRDHGRP